MIPAIQTYDNTHMCDTFTRLSTVMVIEDESVIIEVFEDHLADRFHLLVATSGVMALDHIANAASRIDVILLDHNLPDLSGIEVLKRIKRLRPGLPVVMITGHGNELIAAEAFRQGAREYIKKPFTQKELLDKIGLCLSAERAIPGEATPGTAENVLSYNLETAKQDSRIQRAIRYINDNYSSHLSLTRVADVACMSKYHFSRTFKKVIGRTYQDYLNDMRVKKAMDLLNERARTVTDVAFSVGYSELTHFARVFKKKTGYTPSSFRNGTAKRSFDQE